MNYIDKIEQYTSSEIQIKGYDISVVRKFLDYLGNPDKDLFVFHVGGTSGKGSTSKIISTVLEDMGVRVGLFSSPHVLDIRERIQLDNEMISRDELDRYVHEVISKSKDFQEEIGLRRLTYFEILLVCALLFFRDQKAEVAVIEVGIGGKLDPTNVLFGDVCVLTNVGLDHMKYLGDTVEEIARDKVQIVKKDSVCISGVEQSTVVNIVSDRCKSLGVKLLLYKKEFGGDLTSLTTTGTVFKYKSTSNTSVELNLIGEHQVKNASLALRAVEEYFATHRITSKFDTPLSLSVRNLPGRIEVISEKPMIIWDGAHNGDKMKALVETMSQIQEDKRVVILLAVKKGKKVEMILEELLKLKQVKKIVLTKYKLKQDIDLVSESLSKLKRQIDSMKLGMNVEYAPDAKDAYLQLQKEVSKDEILLVTGSFYLLSTLNSLR